MKKWAVKSIALMVVILMAAAMFSSCGGNQQKDDTATTAETTTASTAAEEVKDPYAAWADAKDSSDIPDWTGKKITITEWHAFGTGGNASNRKYATQDVVRPEVERITGVAFDKDKYFDNNGETCDQVLAKLVASNSLPQVGISVERTSVKQLAEAGAIYDLTDIYEKNMPDVLKLFPKDKLPGMYENIWVNGGQKGKIFAAPFSVQPRWLPDVDSSIDLTKWSLFSQPQDPAPYVMVRDDILKQLFPNAHSRDELDKIYMDNGSFTKEEILDVSINSKEEFFKMLGDIKKLGVKEGGKAVAPFFLNDGNGDYWALLNCLGGIWGWNPNGMQGPDCNYYTYWNKKDQKVDYMYKNPIFKSAIHDLNMLVRDGIVPQQSLIDNNQNFSTKLNNGLYAVTYAWLNASEDALKKAGKTFRYRKVYLNIPVNNEYFSFTKGAVDDGMGSFVIFKNSVKEEDVAQIMRYYDFFATEAGLKLVSWGPRSAGLFDETNGVRKIKDPALENALVNGESNAKEVFYGLLGANPWAGNTNYTLWPLLPQIPNKYTPAMTYERKRSAGDAMNYFGLGYITPFPKVPGQGANFWDFGAKVPQMANFAKAKMEHEKALAKVFTAKDDTEFERLYKEYTDKASQLGLSEDALPLVDKLYKEEINVNNMQYMK